MNNDIKFISTKLRIPSPRKDYIVREKIFNKIGNIYDYKLILIRGGAGIGKTTVAASIIKEKELTDVKWISLDEENNDMLSFWLYFLQAASEFLPSSYGDISNSVEVMRNKEEIKNLIIMIINELSTKGDIIFIFDDFHNLKKDDLINTIEFFIKNSSENVHFMILTREETGMYLEDLRMEGNLLQIDEEDLKLSNDECGKFLKSTLKLGLDTETAKRINEVSEGWIGGIQLMGLARGNYNENGIADIKFLNKYMLNYLSKEVISSLNDDEREFLINTSILDYFNAQICDAYLNISNSRKIIDMLIDRNMFVLNVDDGKNYRYHNIFGEFLRNQLLEKGQDNLRKLHLKASEVYENLGDFEESIKHLFKIKEYGEVIRIIKNMGHSSNSWSFIVRLPIDEVIKDNDIAFQRIFYHYCCLDIEEAVKVLRRLSEKENDEQTSIAVKSTLSLINDNLNNYITMPIAQINNMNISAITKAILYIKAAAGILKVQDRYKEALNLIDKAEEIQRGESNPYMTFMILTTRTQIYEDIGELSRCMEIYSQISSLCDKYSFLYNCKTHLYIGIAGVYLKNFNLTKAKEALDAANEILEKNSVSNSLENGYVYTLIDYKILNDEKNEALSLINDTFGNNIYKNSFYSAQFFQRFFFAGDQDISKLECFIESYEDPNNRFRNIESKILYSRILIVKGEYDKSEEVIDSVLEVSRKNKYKIKLVEGIIVKILLLDKRNEPKREIINLLREAVFYSFNDNILSPFIFDGNIIKKYIQSLKDDRKADLTSKEINFISEIESILNKDNKTQSNLLSQREIEVLTEIETGASNKEIAEKLCISVSTVKTHIINIYSKLQVGSRVEAVEKGKSLEIIKK